MENEKMSGFWKLTNTLLTATSLGSLVLLSSLTAAQAASISIDWNTDFTADGLASGVLDGFDVTFTTTDGNANGGIAAIFSADWATSLGTNDVPGVSDSGVIPEGAAIEWIANQSGFVNLSLDGATVTDPILLFNFADPVVQTFDFADNLVLSLLDGNPANSVDVAAGNVVTTDGSADNTANDGFALQLSGTFSSIQFDTNVLNGPLDTLGFSLLVDEDNVVAVSAVTTPEPLGVLGFGVVLGLGTVLQRKNRFRKV